MSLNVIAQVPAYVPSTGLVAWYSLAGNMADAGPNALNGTNNGGAAVQDRFGNANAALDFFSAYAVAPTNALFNTGAGFTATAWVNLLNSTDNQKVVGRTDISFNSGFILGVGDGHLSPELWDANGTHYAFSSGTMPAGAWAHIAITFAANGSFIGYINGVAVNTVAVGAVGLGANSDQLVIGGSPWSLSPLYFPTSGSIDDIGIWSRALTATEIGDVFNGAPTGIAHPAESSAFAAYPNPVSGTCTVATEEGGTPYTLLDALGRTVLKGATTGGSTVLHMEMLAPGPYTLRIADKDLRTVRLVKQ